MSTPPPVGPPGPADLEVWRTFFERVEVIGVLDLQLVALGPDHATFRHERGPLPPNPNGAINGGLVATLADVAMGAVVSMSSPEGRFGATVDLHLQYHRPAFAPLTIEVRLTAGTRRLAFAEAIVRDAEGRRCSTATSTFVIGAAEVGGPVSS